MNSKLLTMFFIYCFCFLFMVGYYELRTIKMQNRYKQKHDIATDSDITTYEYIFDIKCTKECYH